MTGFRYRGKNKEVVYVIKEDCWCAGAYLINKEVMKPYIDNILFTLQNGWTGAAISAGTFVLVLIFNFL